jgi:two-component system, OmpR family, sensor kinase
VKTRLLNRLGVRIWLAVVLAVLVMTIAFGWLWRAYTDRVRAERLAEQPARELIVRDATGKVLAQALDKSLRPQAQGLDFELTMPSGEKLLMQVPPRPPPPSGQVPSQRWIDANTQRNPEFLIWLWGAMSLAVGLGSYPVVRRLTQRLESLQRGVELWGAGNLRTRVEVQGEDEVGFLAQRFNAAADRIEALVQSHKSLLANASHELRSPLARIRMGLELIKQAPSAALSAELARNINELDALIDEILLSSRLDAAQHSPSVTVGHVEEVDMIGLVAEECARLNVPLDCQAQSLQVQGVPRLLHRMVRNLLENAQRHGGGSGRDDVQVLLRHATVGGHSGVEIQVSDRGPGVPEAERERIFEPFYRSSNASERDGGVGLGLALVKSIAQSHGGSVACQGREGGGASFVALLVGRKT